MRKSTIITNLIFAVIFSAMVLLAMSYTSGAWFARESKGTETIQPKAFDAELSIGKKISETTVVLNFPLIFRMSTKLGLDDNFNMAAIPVVFNIVNVGEVACKLRTEITPLMADTGTNPIKFAFRNLSMDEISADTAADSKGRKGLLKQVYAALNANIYSGTEPTGLISAADLIQSNHLEIWDKEIQAGQTKTVTAIFWIDYNLIGEHGYIQNGDSEHTQFNISVIMRAADKNAP